MNTCHNIPEKSSTTKINGHTPCRYSLFTHCLFDTTKNKLAYYSGKNSMKNFCLDLREHARKKFHREQNVCYICKNRLSTNDNNKRYYKVRVHCHYKGKYTGSGYNICNLRYITRREIPVVFYNGFIYDYHSIIKELAEEI